MVEEREERVRVGGREGEGCIPGGTLDRAVR